jgi:hypothetical protein
LVGTTEVYSGIGADIVMESITLRNPPVATEGVLSVMAMFQQLSLGFLASAEKVVIVPKMRRPYNTVFTMNANDIVLAYQFKASRKTPSPL